MRARVLVLLAVTAGLAACGSSPEQQAASACGDQIATKLKGKTYEIDLHDLAAHAKAESADTYLLVTTARFDKGLSTEYKQNVDCRVRFDNGGKTATVLYLDFKWENADLKKAE
jgi:hypothetical protein